MGQVLQRLDHWLNIYPCFLDTSMKMETMYVHDGISVYQWYIHKISIKIHLTKITCMMLGHCHWWDFHDMFRVKSLLSSAHFPSLSPALSFKVDSTCTPRNSFNLLVMPTPRWSTGENLVVFMVFFSGQDTFYWTFFVISFPFLDSVEWESFNTSIIMAYRSYGNGKLFD